MGNGGRESRQARLYAEAAETFGPALDRLAGAYERDADRRQDLLQEIHVAIWRSLARFDGRCSLRTWIYRVAHNTAISITLRPRAGAPTVIGLDEATTSIASAGHDDEGDIDHRRALDRIHDLILQLRPLDRQVILLYLEELDAASIGEITGLSPANVATRVRRVKRSLAQRFHDRSSHGHQS